MKKKIIALKKSYALKVEDLEIGDLLISKNSVDYDDFWNDQIIFRVINPQPRNITVEVVSMTEDHPFYDSDYPDALIGEEYTISLQKFKRYTPPAKSFKISYTSKKGEDKIETVQALTLEAAKKELKDVKSINWHIAE